ncbi:MAG: hypothetical protein ACKO5F_04985 [Synechococcus sp.]
MKSPRIAASLALGFSLLSWVGALLPSRADQSPGDTAPEAAPQPELAPEPEPSPWAATLELYGFGPLRTTGTTTIREFSSEVDLDLGQALDALEWATTVRGSLERGRWGLLTDLSYVRLGNESGRTTRGGLLSGNTDIRSTQGIYDLGVCRPYRPARRAQRTLRPQTGSVRYRMLFVLLTIAMVLIRL